VAPSLAARAANNAAAGDRSADEVSLLLESPFPVNAAFHPPGSLRPPASSERSAQPYPLYRLIALWPFAARFGFAIGAET